MLPGKAFPMRAVTVIPHCAGVCRSYCGAETTLPMLSSAPDGGYHDRPRIPDDPAD